MEVIIFEKEAYWKMQEQLIKMFKAALKEATAKSEEEWISLAEAQALLGVKSKSKMQELRNHNKIRFSQHGKKLIKYSKTSILQYLEKNVPKY